MNGGSGWRGWLPLLLISSVGLFLELAVIRWIAAEVRLFSYFKNLPLLAAFLGLSIGFAHAGKTRDYLPSFAPLLGIFVVLVLGVGRAISPLGLPYPGSGDEFLWFTVDFSYVLSLFLFLGVLLVFFAATTLLLIPLGQATGREMYGRPPVPAYIVNLLGSLAGIWIFALLAYLETPPAVWFGLMLAGLGAYLAIRQSLSKVFLAVGPIVVLALAAFGRDIIWSAYQRLDVEDELIAKESDGQLVKVGYRLNVQQVFYQVALDLSETFVDQWGEEIPILEDAARSYELPYLFRPPGGRVLVVGAGMGNDVAAALRRGAGHVEAVEIDPAIASVGRQLHPESPYDDRRVQLVIDDARSFLERTPEEYDVIVFGYLDTHTMLSSFSSVRLDSFVYTMESFAQVRDRLASDGVVALSFAPSGHAWVEQRLGQMLVDVFGPDKVFIGNALHGVTFVVGAFPPELTAQNQVSLWRGAEGAGPVPSATDDWPYLYLRDRRIPAGYWQALLLLGLVALAFLARSFPESLRPQWDFWLLGAAFLLIEFKSITELALLFGTTWLVNVLAISGVLLMALGANLVVLKRPGLPLRTVYVLVFASLALAYLLPIRLLVGLPLAVRVLGGTTLLSLPIFFAGVIFSESLRRAGEAARPLASNLSGSVVGGVLEYGSLVWGIKSLYLLAAVAYAGSWIASRLQRR